MDGSSFRRKRRRDERRVRATLRDLKRSGLVLVLDPERPWLEQSLLLTRRGQECRDEVARLLVRHSMIVG